MNDSWDKLISELEEKSESLRDERLKLSSQYFESGQSSPTQSDSFYIDNVPSGSYLASLRFDWRRHFSLSDRICVNLLPTLYSGLLYYDTVITRIYPCPQNQFDEIHDFKFSDIETICSLHDQKRIILTLALTPVEYKAYPYLQPLFERVKPLQLPHMPARLVNSADYNPLFEKMTDDLSEIPALKRAIARKAVQGRESFQSTEGGMILALQELYYFGFSELKDLAFKILMDDPEFGLEFIYALKRLVINPMNATPGIPYCWPHDSLLKDYWLIGRQMNIRNISIPGEIGAVLETKLSFPTPSNWDGLKWCDEHLDVSGIRGAFATLEKQTLDELAKNGDYLGTIRDAIETNWNKQIRASARLHHLIYWGATLSVGALGTYVSGPLAGLLASFGLTTVSNTMISPFTKGLTKRIAGSMFHLWKLNEMGGRSS
jgi:hypothetical protein